VSPEQFADLIKRQLDLFETEEVALIADCDEAERAYNAADREDAEERYSEYLDFVETTPAAIPAMKEPGRRPPRSTRRPSTAPS